MKKNFLKLFVQIIDITYSQWSEFKKVYKSTNQIIDIQSINKNKKNVKVNYSNYWYSVNEFEKGS